ncbi:MAG: phosphoglycerate mutase family protein [Luteimonas sp.]
MKLAHRLKLLATALLAMATFAACASQRPLNAGEEVYLVVRHAEKGNDDRRDPSLSVAGQTRAIELARIAAAKPLVAAYATSFKRTQQTAQPSAEASGIAVTTYDAAMSAADFAAELRRMHPHGVTLVVGHSNTVPEIAAALCACSVAPMEESEYDRLYEVRFDSDGHPYMLARRY